MLLAFALSAVCLVAPVDGPVINDYAPVDSYGGHWGIDYAAARGTSVRAPASGRVTFAGSVAGMRSVTLEPVPGFRVSLSYLSDIAVSSGTVVDRGDAIGASGSPHGFDGVHLSTRIEGEYVDPETQLGCRDTDITRALRLVTPPGPYPRQRAHRDPGWDLRSDPYRPSPRRRDGAVRSRPRPGVVHARRRPMAKRDTRADARHPTSGDDETCHRRDGSIRDRRS
jgi:murein DD-endopeptidase MepM/ murein hydrolase activator NlpD